MRTSRVGQGQWKGCQQTRLGSTCPSSCRLVSSPRSPFLVILRCFLLPLPDRRGWDSFFQRPPLCLLSLAVSGVWAVGFTSVLGSVMAWHLRWKLDLRLWLESGVEMAWGYFNHGSHIHCVPCRVRNLKTLNLGLIWSLPVVSALTAPSELSCSLFLPRL